MRTYEDTYQHKGLRKKLMDLLREKGITDENVLQAMNNIPRHYFLDSAFDKIAYEDRAFPISEGQTISQPYTVAYQTQLLQIKPNLQYFFVGFYLQQLGLISNRVRLRNGLPFADGECTIFISDLIKSAV